MLSSWCKTLGPYSLGARNRREAKSGQLEEGGLHISAAEELGSPCPQNTCTCVLCTHSVPAEPASPASGSRIPAQLGALCDLELC